jgi:hypothetical protein
MPMSTHVEKYSGNYQAGHMSHPPAPPDYMVPRGPHYETELRSWNLNTQMLRATELCPSGAIVRWNSELASVL